MKTDGAKCAFLALLIATLALFGVHAHRCHTTAVERDRVTDELIRALEESTAALESLQAPKPKPAPGMFRPGDIII